MAVGDISPGSLEFLELEVSWRSRLVVTGGTCDRFDSPCPEYLFPELSSEIYVSIGDNRGGYSIRGKHIVLDQLSGFSCCSCNRYGSLVCFE